VMVDMQELRRRFRNRLGLIYAVVIAGLVIEALMVVSTLSGGSPVAMKGKTVASVKWTEVSGSGGSVVARPEVDVSHAAAPTPVSAPEPASLMLMLPAVMLLGRRRGRN